MYTCMNSITNDVHKNRRITLTSLLPELSQGFTYSQMSKKPMTMRPRLRRKKW